MAPGRPDLPLRYVRAAVQQLAQRREQVISSAARCLAAADEATRPGAPRLPSWHSGTMSMPTFSPAGSIIWASARRRSETWAAIDQATRTLAGLRLHSGLDGCRCAERDRQFVGRRRTRAGADEAPQCRGASSAESRCSRCVAKSRSQGPLKITGSVQDAHPECGNGITWSLEVRRGQSRETLASGVSQGATLIPFGPLENIRVARGMWSALVIGPRDGNHVCDLTAH